MIYKMGERHYWPSYGRFLQRDPLTYYKMPAPSRPLGVNPYIYAENNPVMKTDPGGLQAGMTPPPGYYRGAFMGGGSMFLGTVSPGAGSMYDCCGRCHLPPVASLLIFLLLLFEWLPRFPSI